MSNLKGKNAVITGASKGIGKAIAMRLAENGINLVLAARTKDTLDQAVKEIADKTKVKVIGVPTDVGKLEDSWSFGSRDKLTRSPLSEASLD